MKRADSWIASARRLVRGRFRFKRRIRGEWEEAGGIAVAIATALGVVLIGVSSFPYTVDDAFVVARYAERWAAGHGPTMNDGPPTDGVTGPLWLFVLTIVARLDGDPILAAKILGLLGAASGAALVVARAGRDRPGAGLSMGAILVVQPTLGIWGVAGLETGAAVLATSIAALATLADRPRPLVAGGAVGALAWLRPELALACLVLLAALGLRDRKAFLQAVSLASMLAVGVVAYRLALFGSALPLSFAAKPPGPTAGVTYVVFATIATTGGLGLAWAAVATLREGSFRSRVLVAVIAAHALALLLAGGDWMPGFRLFAPVLPLVAWVIGERFAVSRRGLLPIVALACSLLAPSLDLVVQLPRAREAGSRREDRGRVLAASLADHRTVALVDIGFLARKGGFEVVDLGGITDPTIGRAKGVHLAKRIDPGYLAARDPDAIVLHAAQPPEVDSDGRLVRLAGYPVERAVASMPFVRSFYEVTRVVPYAPDYVYVILERRPPSSDVTSERRGRRVSASAP